jgi:CO/xanthine dehydrogenase FAD-binding subunit
VGGGIWMRLGSRHVATAIDLSACGFDQIEETETEFRIGAMCTLRQLERHAELNALVNNVFEFAVHDIVGVQLRNTATVGGSIYGRFGFSDVLSAFLALDSCVELTGAGRVPLAEFVDMGYVRDVIEHIVVVKHDYRASYEAVRFSYPHFEFGPELECLGGVDKKAPSQISYPEPSATRGEVVSQKRVRALAARICYHS